MSDLKKRKKKLDIKIRGEPDASKAHRVRASAGTIEFFNLSRGKRDDDYSSGATYSVGRAGADPESANSILLPPSLSGCKISGSRRTSNFRLSFSSFVVAL